MLPNEYVNTYLNLWFRLDATPTPFAAPVRKYLQAQMGEQSKRAQAAYQQLLYRLRTLLGPEQTTALYKGLFQFESNPYLTHSLRRVYEGKGSPSEIQDAVYLAARCGLVSASTLIDYLDNNVGMDCGGFVANYWGMGRPDVSLLNPVGADGFAPRTIWNMYRKFRRSSVAEIQPGDAAIFFRDVKQEGPDVAAKFVEKVETKSDGTTKVVKTLDTSSGSQAEHIALVSSVRPVPGDQVTLEIAEGSGAPASSGGNGVNTRTLGQDPLKATVANNLVYVPSGNNRVYFIGRPGSAPPYMPDPVAP